MTLCTLGEIKDERPHFCNKSYWKRGCLRLISRCTLTRSTASAMAAMAANDMHLVVS